MIPNFLFQNEYPEDYKRISGVLDTPGYEQRCEQVQMNNTYILDLLTDNGTYLNETMKCKLERFTYYVNRILTYLDTELSVCVIAFDSLA